MAAKQPADPAAAAGPPLRVLFLCTRNSARSQIAEALLAHEGRGAFDVASAGGDPAMHVDPLTFEVLDELGIEWRAHRPKGFEAVMNMHWDVVVTVCDEAREACPVLPGRPAFAHWPLEDPVQGRGSPGERRKAFVETVGILRHHIRQLPALPLAQLDRREAEERLAAIAAHDEHPGAVERHSSRRTPEMHDPGG